MKKKFIRLASIACIVYTSMHIFYDFKGRHAHANNQFSIYCTSNFDYTGECLSETGSSIDCVTVPGGIIACRDKDLQVFECVQYGAIINFQSEFLCEPDIDSSVNAKVFEASDIGINSSIDQNPIQIDLDQKPEPASSKTQTNPQDSRQIKVEDSVKNSPANIFQEALIDSRFKDTDNSNEFINSF